MTYLLSNVFQYATACREGAQGLPYGDFHGHVTVIIAYDLVIIFDGTVTSADLYQ